MSKKEPSVPVVNDYSVKNGRIVFSDKKVMASLTNKLMNLDSFSFANFEKQNNFKSYKSFSDKIIMENWHKFLKGDTTNLRDYNKYVFGGLACINNDNAEMQIGDTVFLTKGKKIYAIPYSNEANFQKCKEQIESIGAENMNKTFKSENVIIDTLKIKSLGNLKYANAGYQSQWAYGPFQFKMVFEVVSDHHQIIINNRLEYLSHSGWTIAGESTNKSADASISYELESDYQISIDHHTGLVNPFAPPYSHYLGNIGYSVFNYGNYGRGFYTSDYIYHFLVRGRMSQSTSNWSPNHNYSVANTLWEVRSF